MTRRETAMALTLVATVVVAAYLGLALRPLDVQRAELDEEVQRKCSNIEYQANGDLTKGARLYEYCQTAKYKLQLFLADHPDSAKKK